jgi:hypothetical protein
MVAIWKLAFLHSANGPLTFSKHRCDLRQSQRSVLKGSLKAISVKLVQGSAKVIFAFFITGAAHWNIIGNKKVKKKIKRHCQLPHQKTNKVF